MANIGKIISARGPVIDIAFASEDKLPRLNTAIRIQNGEEELVVEVAQHIGDDAVRCIAMGPTDGVVRGMDAVDTGHPISVPVGNDTLGRMFNVLGEPIDGKGELGNDVPRMPIHRSAPTYAEQDMKSGDENLIKQAEAKYEEIDRKITEAVVNYILTHTDKQSAAKNLYDFRYNIDEDRQNEIISKADSSFKSVPGINYMIDHLNVLKKVAVGQKFTDFEMPDAKGEMHKLSEYVGNGKVVLIDFWASWCPPCRAEMPNLVKAYKDYKGKGFDIVGISLDSKADAWAKGVKDLNITWTQLSDLKGWQNGGAALYGVNSIPHTVLVDKDGTIIAKNLHGQELEDQIKEVLK